MSTLRRSSSTTGCFIPALHGSSPMLRVSEETRKTGAKHLAKCIIPGSQGTSRQQAISHASREATAEDHIPSSCTIPEAGAKSRSEFLETAWATTGGAAIAGVAFFGGGSGKRAVAAETQSLVNDPDAVLERQVLADVREALPSWRSLPDADINLKQIKGGITNVIFKAKNAVTGEGALVRIYGKDTDLLLDRRKEAAVFSELSNLGFGPHKLGEFKGGRVEELLDARAATPAELLQERPFDVPTAIAVQLATLHGQKVRSSPGAPDRPVMWKTIDKWLRTAAELDKKKMFPLDQMVGEVAWLKKILPGSSPGGDSTASPHQTLAASIADGVVFAHNDLLGGNVLVGPRGAKRISTLRLIDFEYSDYNYCGYDIANHFCECAGFDADFRTGYPSLAQRIRFLRAYVEAARADVIPQLTSDGISTEAFFEELAKRVDRYTLASHLTWALWAIIQANTSEIEDFDFEDYAKKRFNGYMFHKDQFFTAQL